jgi:hypothetical protein
MAFLELVQDLPSKAKTGVLLICLSIGKKVLEHV